MRSLKLSLRNAQRRLGTYHQASCLRRAASRRPPTGMLARRYPLHPVHEAKYEPRQIPNASRDMEGTAIIRPPRELWLTLLGEMVQMVNEAVRRRANCARDATKPLSLEYMADRLDVDDPLGIRILPKHALRGNPILAPARGDPATTSPVQSCRTLAGIARCCSTQETDGP